MPARLPGEAVDLAEAEARALPDRLGGEERLERLCQHVGRHAGAAVGDGDHHVLRPPSGRVRRDIGVVEMGVGRLDGQLAAVRHGVAGVDGEVEEARSRAGWGRPRCATGRRRSTVSTSIVSPSVRPKQFRHAADQPLRSSARVAAAGAARRPAGAGSGSRRAGRAFAGRVAEQVVAPSAGPTASVAAGRGCR